MPTKLSIICLVSQTIATDTVPLCVKKNKTTNEKHEQAKARIFVELISYIECALKEGTYLFKVKELRVMYQNQLKDTGYDFEVNKNALKESILRHFEEYGLQEQSDNKNKIFVFRDGVQQLIKDAFKNRDCQSEALQSCRSLQK